MGIPTQVSILNIIKHLFFSEPIKNSRCISLWEVEQLRRKQYCKIDSKVAEYKDQMVALLKTMPAYENYSPAIVINFSARKSEMTIDIFRHGKWETIILSKKPCNVYGNIFVKKTNSTHAREYLELLDSVLSELYNFYIQYWQFYAQSSYDVQSVNSRFLVDISHWSSKIKIDDDFKLTSDGCEGISCVCPSAILNVITGKEEEILKKVFVKIKDCPLWMQSILQEIRQKQLEEFQNGETERQKRMEFINRFLPFL